MGHSAELPCPIQDRCGGCPELPVPHEAQLARKAERVAALLGRAPDRVLPSPRQLGYRARITLRPGPQGRLGYAAPRSHAHVPVEVCAIARPPIADLAGRLPPFPGVERVELRTDDTRVVLAAERPRRGRGKVRVPRLDLEALGLDGIALDGRRLTGEVELRVPCGPFEQHLSPRSFLQVNPEQNAALVALVVERVRAVQPERLLDLYSGAGNLSAGLAAEGLPVTWLESSPSAVSDARRLVAAHGLPVEVRQGDAHRFEAGEAVFDVAILDPPRQGAPGRLAQLCLTRPKRILYVSCHPPALRRDLQEARAAGYHLAELVLVDMFPQTRHTELLAVLDPEGGP